MFLLQSDFRSAIRIPASAYCRLQSESRPKPSHFSTARQFAPRAGSPAACLRAFYGAPSDSVGKSMEKPSICTADELHYVSVSNSGWRLALWRYTPSSKATHRNHPLLLLSGVATNATGYDLSPESSFARYMSSQGFDTWILEVRGAGLSTQGADAREIKGPANAMSEQLDSAIKHGTNGILSAESPSVINPDALAEYKISSFNGEKTKIVTKSVELQDSQLYERNGTRGKLSGLLEARQNSGIASQIRDLSQRLVNIIAEGQRSVSLLFDFQKSFSTTIKDFQKQIDLILKYDWDFDHYLEEDVPAAMEYIRTQCKPTDGKLLAIGHSMGGILLYAILSRHGIILTESNYDISSQLMEMHIAERENLSFLRGKTDPPAESENGYEKWYAENQKVKRWLMMSMSPEIMKCYLRLPTAREIWSALSKVFYDGSDELQVFSLNQKAFTTRQSGKSLSIYYGELTEIFQELDHRDKVVMKDPNDIELY